MPSQPTSSLQQHSDKPSFARYLALFKREFLVIAVFSLISNLLMLAPTLYMLQLYDRVLISKNELTLYAVTLITCLLLAFMAFSEWMRSLIVIRAGVRFDQLLGSKIFRLGFAGALSSLRSRSGEAMQDLTNIRQFLTGNGLFAFFDMPWTLLYIAVLFILHPLLGALAIAFCLIQFGLGVWNQRSSERPLQQVAEAGQSNQRFLDSKVRNIETLHVMGMIPHLFRRWQVLQQRWHSLDSASLNVQTRNQLISKFVRYSMQSLMLAVAALLAIQGKISIGAMIASNVLIARAMQPFDVIVTTWKQCIQVQQAMRRLNVLLASEQPEPDDAVAFAESMSSNERCMIQLRGLNVNLGSDQRFVLKDIDLDIQPGQILTVMGHSGSGKTTLMRCLAGILQCQAGQMLINYMDATAIPRQQRAQSLGYLPQDIDLIEGSIADNIARFNKPDPERVIAAARAAGIHNSILRLSQGYNTKIAESGVLSGGQRQLLGFARAIYGEPALLLLDEPNSHLDEHGEASLLACLRNLRQQGKTIVLVSHRSSILKITDQLLIMKGGEIAHYGPRDSVMAELQQARQQLAA